MVCLVAFVMQLGKVEIVVLLGVCLVTCHIVECGVWLLSDNIEIFSGLPYAGFFCLDVGVLI